MIRDLLKTKNLLYVATLSGITLGLLLIFVSHTTTNPPIWGDILSLILIHLAAIIAIGYAAGFALKHSVRNSYFVSIAAMLYLYDAAALLAPIRGFGYIIFTLLLALVSVGLFIVANKLLNKYSSRKKGLLVFVINGFIVLWIICAPLGLFVTRFISSY